MLSNLSQYQKALANQLTLVPTELIWQRELSGGTFSHQLRLNETGKTPEDIKILKLRTICHYLFDLLPNEAIPELIETLISLNDFYSLRKSSPIKNLPSEDFQSEFEEPTIRPEILIEED